ncbi:MAG: trigger factor [Bacillota bacterium]
MKIDATKQPGCKASIDVEIEPEKFEEALNKVYVDLNRRTAVPGFRIGKTPKEILFRHLGQETVYSEATKVLLRENLDQAIKESGLNVWGTPEVEVLEVGNGKPFRFRVAVELQPEVSLGDYRTIAVAGEEVSVSEEEVKQQLELLQEVQSELVSVENLPLKEGLFAVLDVEGQIQGEEGQGVSWENVSLRVGNETFLPGLDGKILGMVKGEERQIEIQVSDDFADKTVAGKRLSLNVKVKDVKQKRLPSLDDELAKSVGNYASLAELKQDIEKQILVQKDKEAKERQKRKVLDELLSRCKVEVPEGMVARRRDTILSRLLRRLEEKRIPLGAYLRVTGQTVEQLKQEATAEAERQIKEDAVLRAIAAQERVEVSEEEVQEFIETTAKSLGQKDAARFKELFKDQSSREELREDLKVAKVVQYLLDLAAKNASGQV